MKKWLLLSILYTCVFSEADVHIGFSGILDNREYFNRYTIPQTIFGGRTEGDLGFTIDTSNSIRTGVSYLQEFGAPENSDRLDFLAWYAFEGSFSRFLMGSFPREKRISYQRILLGDSLGYYRPQVQGGFFEIFTPSLKENVWVDWTSRQADTIRETFIVGQSGEYRYSSFFFEHQFLMYHRAGPGSELLDDHIRDNMGLIFGIGAAKGNFWFLDSMRLSAGPAVSFDRIRGEYDWKTPVSVLVSGMVSAFNFGISGQYHRGGGHDLAWGDGFYKAAQYGRMDLSYTPINTSSVKARFILGLHFVDNAVDHSEQFFVDMDWGRRIRN